MRRLQAWLGGEPVELWAYGDSAGDDELLAIRRLTRRAISALEPKEPMDLNGSVILVTGASSGIGAALAPQLAARGATVGIVARRADRLEAVLAECREHAPTRTIWAADLGDVDTRDDASRARRRAVRRASTRW